MHKVENSILILLGLWLVNAGFPLWLGICAAAPAIILGGGEEDGDKQRASSKRKRRDRSNAA